MHGRTVRVVRRLSRAAAVYGDGFGWATAIVPEGLVLLLTGGRAGVALPAERARPVVRELHCRDAAGPVLALPGAQPHWVFLAGQDRGPCAPPQGVVLIHSPHVLALPPTSTVDGRVRWVVAPDPRRDRLPAVDTVLGAIRWCA
jgi:hypothetical protein